MHWKAALSLLAILSICALPATADWDDSQPFKWVQHPDLDTTGIDVMASYDQNLADDFECTVTGPLTDIHIWGSWFHDILPEQGDPRGVTFYLSIYADIPAEQSPNGYSQPGDMLWQTTFQPGSFQVREWRTDIEEGWMEYPDLYEFPGDTVCWQYNFFMDPVQAFIQRGTVDEPIVYWLGVTAVPVDGAARFGWKTSLEHWNDDAVWGFRPDPPGGPWEELRYPPQHPMERESIDLAFVITGGAEPQELDFGDAPDQPYPTLAASFGASHVVTPNLHLGLTVDAEPDGQPDGTATGDDINLLYPGLPNDEDGVTFTSPLTIGSMATVDVFSTGGGLLNAWIDFMGNGNWTDPVDQIFVDLPLAPGMNSLSFMVPAGIPPVGRTFSRFRLSSLAGLGPRGAAPDGEVEDHETFINAPREIDFGDAPDGPYPTLAANLGASHDINPNFFLGGQIDSEPNGQPHPNALGDDLAGVNDEDGVIPTSGFLVGQPATVDVFLSGASGTLNAWMDFNANGFWGDPGEQIFLDVPLVGGVNPLGFNIPASAVSGVPIFARYRLSTALGISWDKHLPDGEVEDYEYFIDMPRELDFGDAPDPSYQTLMASNGAYHFVTPNLTLGLTIDVEPDGQPDANAMGDDNNLLYPGVPDDEDGVVFTTTMVPGQPAAVTVTCSAPGYLQVWFDFDVDGTWAQPGEQVAIDLAVVAGPNPVNFIVPVGTPINTWSFARFRLSTSRGIPYFGPAPDGEVEDYHVYFPEPVNYKWRQRPDLETTGIDINASRSFVLADDFLCRVTGPITEIHLWASWLNDWLPFQGNPLAMDVTLSIHADIPAGTDGIEWSRPGELLWLRSSPAGAFDAVPYATDLREGWMNPPVDWDPVGDTVCWEYFFPTPEPENFWQLGDPDAPVVYWLDVKAEPHDPDAWFGWKTSLDHWNDDAVWGRGDEPYAGPWEELRYPVQHPFAGESIDLAFALVGEEKPLEMDFGDAPDPTYPTVLASNGARHVITLGLGLGNLIDPEPNGQPDAAATGDDNSGLPDEDGVTFLTPFIPGQQATIQVDLLGNGVLQAWCDWNANGSWADAGEQFVVDWALVAGSHQFAVNVPASAVPGAVSFMRFRYSTQRGLTEFGPAPDGEVEDHMVRFDEPQTYKWIQNPDLDLTGIDVNASRGFVLADDFLCTMTGPITQVQIWGSWFNDQLPFQGDPLAVEFTLSIHADIPAGVDGIDWSRPGDMLWEWRYPAGAFEVVPFATDLREGWMDPPDAWNPLGDTVCWQYTFDIRPPEAFWQMGDPRDPVIYWLDLQARPLDESAMFGWKTSLDHWNDDAVWGRGEEPYLGPWDELRYPPQHPFSPESIDLAFRIQGEQAQIDQDFGDAPDPRYPTLLASSGARHMIVPGVQLGPRIDPEADGQPTAAADGDDTAGVDDEDGVVFLSPLGVGQITFVDVETTVPGNLNLWIDFGRDGSWNEPGDHVLVDVFVPGGVVNHAIPTPQTALQGLSYARFRFSSQLGLGPTGPAVDGEVEDYAVSIFIPTGNEPATPKRVQLHQNVPNPFNPHTTISYELPRRMDVQLAVYDLRGGLVKILVGESVEQGIHEVRWNGRDQQGRNVASGIYVVRLLTEEVTQSTKITLVR